MQAFLALGDLLLCRAVCRLHEALLERDGQRANHDHLHGVTEEFCGQKAQVDVVAGRVDHLLVVADANRKVVALKQSLWYGTVEVEVKCDHHGYFHVEQLLLSE